MCTRVLRNTDEYGPVLVGRTMDWPLSTEARLVVFPQTTEKLVACALCAVRAGQLTLEMAGLTVRQYRGARRH